MSTASKRRGSSWELDLLRYFRAKLGMKAERLRLAGKLDEGDLAVEDVDMTYVIEAKNTARINLAQYVEEALIERDHYCDARLLRRENVMAVAIVKRRGKGIEEAYVVTTVKEFFSS